MKWRNMKTLGLALLLGWGASTDVAAGAPPKELSTAPNPDDAKHADARLKGHVQDLDYGLKEVMQLHPVKFYHLFESMSEIHLGLLAQEVEPLIPEIVESRGEGGTKKLRYEELIPVLVKAIQEQQAQIEALQEALKEKR